jgi:hypothetical protein
MTARPNSSNAGPPDRPRHVPSDLRRARPVRPAPPLPEGADAATGEDQSYCHDDEVDLQRRLQRRRHGNLPALLIAGVGALALAGGLIVFTSGHEETKPAAPTAQQEAAAAPPLDPRNSEGASSPPRTGPPAEPARNAAPPSASTPEQPAAQPSGQDRAAQPGPPLSGRADIAPSTPGPSAAPSAEVAGLLTRARVTRVNRRRRHRSRSPPA